MFVDARRTHPRMLPAPEVHANRCQRGVEKYGFKNIPGYCLRLWGGNGIESNQASQQFSVERETSCSLKRSFKHLNIILLRRCLHLEFIQRSTCGEDDCFAIIIIVYRIKRYTTGGWECGRFLELKDIRCSQSSI